MIPNLGDVISVNKGMTIFGEVPERFVYTNCVLSDKKVACKFNVGKVLNLQKGNVDNEADTMCNNIKSLFASKLGLEVNQEDVYNFVNAIIKQNPFDQTEYDTIDFCGEYVVTKIERSNLSYCYDTVYCKKLNDGKFDFNGTEICIISDKLNTHHIVRKMKMMFV